jgi:hypothetical protein
MPARNLRMPLRPSSPCNPIAHRQYAGKGALVGGFAFVSETNDDNSLGYVVATAINSSWTDDVPVEPS